MPSTIQPVIMTPDPDRSKRFYAGLLGAVETNRVTHDDGSLFYLGLRIGDSDLGLVADTGPRTAGGGGRILLSVGVSGVDAMLDDVAAHGGRVLGPATNMPWGQRVAHVQDPDGNAVNLTQPV